MTQRPFLSSRRLSGFGVSREGGREGGKEEGYD